MEAQNRVKIWPVIMTQGYQNLQDFEGRPGGFWLGFESSLDAETSLDFLNLGLANSVRFFEQPMGGSAQYFPRFSGFFRYLKLT